MVVIFKKMLLTGALSVVAPGSAAQIIIAIVVVMLNMLVVLKLGPFADSTDDFLAFATSMQMVFTLLAAILLMFDADSKYYDPAYMDGVLVTVNMFSLFALAFSIASMHPKVRAKLNSLGRRKEDIAQASSKVVPAPAFQKETASGGGSGKGDRRSEKSDASTPKNSLEKEAQDLRTWGK